MLWLATLPLLLLAADDEAAPDVQRLHDDAIAQRTLIIQQLKSGLALRQQMLRRGRSGMINAKLTENVTFPDEIRQPVSFRSKDIKTRWVKSMAAEVDQWKKDLPKYQDGTLPLIPYMRAPLSPGVVGTLQDRAVRVKQVVGKEAMLVEMEFRTADNVLLPFRLVYLTGVPTDGITDDSGRRLSGESIFQITGTKRYETPIGGTNTVLAIKAMDDAEKAALRKRLLEK